MGWRCVLPGRLLVSGAAFFVGLLAVQVFGLIENHGNRRQVAKKQYEKLVDSIDPGKPVGLCAIGSAPEHYLGREIRIEDHRLNSVSLFDGLDETVARTTCSEYLSVVVRTDRVPVHKFKHYCVAVVGRQEIISIAINCRLENFLVEDSWRLIHDSDGTQGFGKTLRLNLRLGPVPENYELSQQ